MARNPFLGKAPRVQGRRRCVHRALRFLSASGDGELNLEVTGPVITSRRVGGSSVLLLGGATLRCVSYSRHACSPFRHRDVDHCYSRLHRKLDYGVLRDRPYSRRRRRSTLFGKSREDAASFAPLGPPVLISLPIHARLRNIRAAAFSACIQMHRATMRLWNATTATSKISLSSRDPSDVLLEL